MGKERLTPARLRSHIKNNCDEMGSKILSLTFSLMFHQQRQEYTYNVRNNKREIIKYLSKVNEI